MLGANETIDRLHKLDEVLDILGGWRLRAREINKLEMAEALGQDWRRYDEERRVLMADTTAEELARYNLEKLARLERGVAVGQE
jgi:hypothetical protein